MNDTLKHPPSDPQPGAEVRQLAEEYCAQLADGKSTNLHRYLTQLDTEEQRAEFQEIAESAKLAIGAVQDSSKPRRILNARYRLDDEIGSGGMGRVFRAWDLELERFVAVKVLSLLDVGDAEREELLIKESKILATMNHPNIVTVHETGRDGELVYVVMELVDGESLAKVIERIQVHAGFAKQSGQQSAKGSEVIARAINRPVPKGWVDLLDSGSYSRSVTQVMLQVVRTIEAAHSYNVVHRDLKPSNVMLVGGGNPVVLDFGLAGSSDKAAGVITQGLYGTVAYLAPEQAQSQSVGTDPRTDIYQLGLLLYEFLTLRRAFPDGAIGDVLERIKRGDFPEPRKLRSEIPRDLSAICLKALEVSPANRYQTAAEFREDLESFLSQDRIPSAVKGSSSRAMARHARIAMRRYPMRFAVAAIVLVAALVWNLTPAGEELVLRPDRFFARSESEIREVANEAVVYPTEALGARIESSEPRYVYALSLFADVEDESQKCVRPVLPLSNESELTRAGEWGVRVEPGKSFLWCAEAEGTNAMDGLMLFTSDEESPMIDAWFQRIEAELNDRMEGLVSLDEARVEFRGVMDGTATRGAGLKRPDEAERKRYQALEADFDKREKLFWQKVGVVWNQVECVVKGTAGAE